MEKRDLEIRHNKHIIGAFENVSNIMADDDHVVFDSDDGHFEFEKDAHGIYHADNTTIIFTDWGLQVRRTTKAHMPNGKSTKLKNFFGAEEE